MNIRTQRTLKVLNRSTESMRTLRRKGSDTVNRLLPAVTMPFTSPRRFLKQCPRMTREGWQAKEQPQANTIPQVKYRGSMVLYQKKRTNHQGLLRKWMLIHLEVTTASQPINQSTQLTTVNKSLYILIVEQPCISLIQQLFYLLLPLSIYLSPSTAKFHRIH